MGGGAKSGLRIDRGIPGQPAQVPQAATKAEQLGYDGCWTGEVNHDPFLPMLLAAEHTNRLEIGTGVAVAFARTPMTGATVAWDLQAYSQGRFILGLGTQIRPHIERRFSMPWSRPVPRMREFVAALREIWSAWQHGTPLRFEGDFYTHTLMTPMFVPEPHPYGPPRVFLSAVGPALTELCGEVADGLVAHAFTTRRYLQQVTLPALEAGLRRAGRSRAEVEVACPVFVVTGRTEEDLRAAVAPTRGQLAFYGSTPAYRPVLELHGWGELHTELHRLSRAGKWDAMAGLIDDEVLGAFAVVAPVDELAAALADRYAGVVDRVMFSFPPGVPTATVTAVLDRLRGLAAAAGRSRS